MKYEITLDAEKDLIEIWGYTINKWGERQAREYLDNIADCFYDIAADDVFYKPIFFDSKEVNYTRCEHHYIFFLSENKPIILAVVHEKRDFISVLKKRLSA